MWHDLVDVVGRALFPARCAACCAPGEPLCEACRATLVAASPMPPPIGVDRCIAAFVYAGAAREVVARVKYRDARHALGMLATAVTKPAARLVTPDTVVSWPPTTRERRRARGFDHAELLARRVAAELARPAVNLLRRTDAAPQTGRSAAQRRRGPQFALREPAADTPLEVLLVDDVTTTGATLTAAARVLRAGGTTRVVAVVAARTPPRRRGGAQPDDGCARSVSST